MKNLKEPQRSKLLSMDKAETRSIMTRRNKENIREEN